MSLFCFNSTFSFTPSFLCSFVLMLLPSGGLDIGRTVEVVGLLGLGFRVLRHRVCVCVEWRRVGFLMSGFMGLISGMWAAMQGFRVL